MIKSIELIKIISTIALSLALSACGGSGSDFGSKSNSGSGTDTDTDTDTGGTGTPDELIFTLQPLEVGLSSLAAGGSTGMTTRLIDQNGNFANTSYTIAFTSPCISNGSSEVVSPITSSTGVFTTTYTAKGCEGTDKITATVNGLSVSTTVSVEAAELGAVEFVGASPKTILLKGMSAPGLQHTSTVTFQIKNNVGGPLANEDVTFELVTPSAGDGGISLASTVGKTDNDGFVSTILQAGSVHTTVRVRATVERNGVSIASESSQVVISTGIADQNSLSLSFQTLNPAAWEYDGVEVEVYLHASDRYNNPVADGTAVSFYTELGSIEPACETINGYCSVIWKSSSPKDLGITDGRYPRDSLTFNSDGITTVTAKVIGEESFLDSNANGIFDDGDKFDLLSDRGEAYADYNMNYDIDGDGITDQQYDQGLDRFILDYNGNGVYDPKDGKYTGLGCKHSTLCASGNGLKDIFTFGEIVMSEDNQSIRVWSYNNSGVRELIYDSTTGRSVPLTNYKAYLVEVFGVVNKQVPPIETTIGVSSENAEVASSEAIVPNINTHGSDITKPYGPYITSFSLSPGTDRTGAVEILVSTGIDQSFGLYYDSIPPVIVLNGQSTLYYNSLGLAYIEQGASALDNHELTEPQIVVSGDTVDTSVEGEYEVIYTAEDLAGNMSSETRTVIVDATPPVITLNGAETMTLVVGAIYKENSVVVTDNVKVDYSTLLIGGEVDTSQAGTYTITYNVHDAAGNPATEVIRTVIVN